MHNHKENVVSLATRSFFHFLFGFLALIATAFLVITITGKYAEEGVPPADLAAPADSAE